MTRRIDLAYRQISLRIHLFDRDDFIGHRIPQAITPLDLSSFVGHRDNDTNTSHSILLSEPCLLSSRYLEISNLKPDSLPS